MVAILGGYHRPLKNFYFLSSSFSQGYVLCKFQMSFPVDLSHLLQQLDRSVFRPVKAQWQRQLRQYARTHRGPVGKKSFPAQLSTLFDKEMIEAGFQSTGIFPFYRNAIPVDEMMQAEPFQSVESSVESTEPAPSTAVGIIS